MITLSFSIDGFDSAEGLTLLKNMTDERTKCCVWTLIHSWWWFFYFWRSFMMMTLIHAALVWFNATFMVNKRQKQKTRVHTHYIHQLFFRLVRPSPKSVQNGWSCKSLKPFFSVFWGFHLPITVCSVSVYTSSISQHSVHSAVHGRCRTACPVLSSNGDRIP